jgi:glycolate oxidase iron-sulfur subunit
MTLDRKLSLVTTQPQLITPIKRGFAGRDVPEDRIIQSCIHCGLCLPYCPTYLETGSETSSPRGRIHLIEAVADGRLSVTDSGFVEQMYQCLDCRACEDVCPSGVEYGKLVEAARTQIEHATPGSPVKRGLRWIIFRQLFGNMHLFRLFSRLLYFYQHFGIQWLVRHLGILRILRLDEMEQLLPKFPAYFLTLDRQRYEPTVSSPVEEVRIALFAGCIMSTAFAETDRATIRVLQATGCTVVVPARQGCCGALTVHAGDMDAARMMARQNIDAFEQSGATYIVSNAAGCGAALKEYVHLLHEDPVYADRAARFSARIRDISELLATRQFVVPLRPVPLKVTYQEPCHLVHAQRIGVQPRELLRRIPGLELVEMQESGVCCGSAGIYNVTQPEMSRQLQERKITHTTETQADVVITANPGCYLQLQSGLQRINSPMRVMHIVDLLDMAI